MKTFRIKKILVPIDFSDISLSALQHAVVLAGLTRAKLILLHVVQPYVYHFEDGASMIAASKFENAVLTQSTKRFVNIAAKIRNKSQPRIETKVILGTIARTIVHTASKMNANLIVMGTHGSNGFLDNVLGSNTYHVTALSTIPVLSVHKKLGQRGYTQIVYPVREETHFEDKLPYAIAFAGLFKAKVDIVGFVREGEFTRGELMRANCMKLRQIFEHHGIRAKARFTSNESFAAETMSRVSSNSLVMITRDRDFGLVELFRKSFTKGILHKVVSPIVTVPNRRRRTGR